MEIKAIATFTLNGKYYEPGDVVDNATLDDVARLNAKGLIEPLTRKELINYGSKEEEKNGKTI